MANTMVRDKRSPRLMMDQMSGHRMRGQMINDIDRPLEWCKLVLNVRDHSQPAPTLH